jgi:hypothetical protein
MIGKVIDSFSSCERGPVAYIQIDSGILRQRDLILAGNATGRISIVSIEVFDQRTIAEVTGLNMVPVKGDYVTNIS